MELTTRIFTSLPDEGATFYVMRTALRQPRAVISIPAENTLSAGLRPSPLTAATESAPP